MALLEGTHSWLLKCLLISAVLLESGGLLAEPVAVRHMEGTFHGFLVLRTMEGKALAAGDLIEISRGNRVVCHLVFRFNDGSVDDEGTVFSQHVSLQLLSDHHVQKGPSFPHPMDVSIDTSSGEVKVRSSKGGKQKVETDHLDLPPDLSNGLLLAVLKNIAPDAGETKVSFLASDPKPRVVKLAIAPQGEDTFSIAGWRHRATRYVVKVELGGLAGIVAPFIGKQPADSYVWVLGGGAPAFVRFEGPLYLGGPTWRIELASPVWQRSPDSGR